MNIIIVSITIVITSTALYCIRMSHRNRYVDIESEMWIYASKVSEFEGQDKNSQGVLWYLDFDFEQSPPFADYVSFVSQHWQRNVTTVATRLFSWRIAIL
jgi:hypothetical protein